MKKKNEENINREKIKQLFSLIIVQLVITLSLLLFVGGIIYQIGTRLADVESQIADLPKRVCHTEEIVTKVELKSTCLNTTWGGTWCSAGRYYFDDDADVKCEDEVVIYGAWGYVVNYDEEVKICLITEKKEVCEIV